MRLEARAERSEARLDVSAVLPDGPRARPASYQRGSVGHEREIEQRKRGAQDNCCRWRFHFDPPVMALSRTAGEHRKRCLTSKTFYFQGALFLLHEGSSGSARDLIFPQFVIRSCSFDFVHDMLIWVTYG
jgi:hypothetical protein